VLDDDPSLFAHEPPLLTFAVVTCTLWFVTTLLVRNEGFSVIFFALLFVLFALVMLLVAGSSLVGALVALLFVATAGLALGSLVWSR